LRFNEAAALFVAALLVACACGEPASSLNTPLAQLDTSVASLRAGQVVDSIPCLTDELPMNHIHVHLVVLFNGANVTVPAGVGVGRPWGVDPDGFISTGACFAWIHTHDATGVVHIFSPGGKTYTLGQVFSVWGHALGTDRAFNFSGAMRVLVNGDRVTGDPAAVQLGNYFNIVLELGQPPATPPAPNYNFSSTRR
jgi:hypothetical protein